ncbi:MAG: carbohydrate binding family 9 domain-containing protein, partial [Gemmatimonadaceae bacterium]
MPVLLTAPAAAQSAGTLAACGPTARQRSVRAGRITGSAPDIDGRLDEPIWSAAPVTSRFVQLRPDPYAPGTDSTQVRVLIGEHALYIGMRLFRRDRSRIAATVARRDY